MRQYMTNLKILFLIFISNITLAGIEWGNGGNIGSHHANNTAWFIDDSTQINYCIKRHEFFSLELEKAQKQIRAAINTWVTYINDIDKLSYKMEPNQHKAHFFSKSFNYVKNCNKAQLKFYLGYKLRDRDFRKTLEQYKSVAAFSKREDFGKSVTSGYIYIKNSNQFYHDKKDNINIPIPNWRSPGSFHAIILHELGHVFGVDHHNGTIMRNDLVDLLLKHQDKNTNIPENFHFKIDHEYTLKPDSYITQRKYKDINYVFNYNQNNFSLEHAADEYNFLADQAQVNQQRNNEHEELRITIHQGNSRIPSDIYLNISRPQCLFRKILYKETRDNISNLYHHCLIKRFEKATVEGKLSIGGRELPAIYYKNVNRDSHKIKYFDQDKWTNL